jgi:molybdate transport system ATP-binding protein
MTDRTLAVDLAQDGPIPLRVRFECEPGQVVALFGPSGSGKTTILRSIAGLHRPRQGTVTVGTERWLDTAAHVDVPARRRPVGFVFQEYALFPHLTARGNVMTALEHRPRAERQARALELLGLVHLRERAEHLPAALSGGERQRVAVARALAREPRVLLLDEPFAAVDARLRRCLHDELDEVRRAFDIPIVLVTHDYQDVIRLATHLVALEGGHVVASGPLESLTSQPDMPWLRDAVGLGTVLDAEVRRIEPTRGLAELQIPGAVLLAPADGLSVGTRVRVRIPARDVILATEAPSGLSVHNVLRGTVAQVDHVAGHVAVVQLAVGDSRLLAEVTSDAVARMAITPGLSLNALVKSVSLQVAGECRVTSPEPRRSGPGR